MKVLKVMHQDFMIWCIMKIEEKNTKVPADKFADLLMTDLLSQICIGILRLPIVYFEDTIKVSDSLLDTSI